MAIFKRMTKKEIKEKFTYYGFFCGIVPIYLDSKPCPTLAVRNWYPDLILDVVSNFWQALNYIGVFINPDFEYGFAITITGEID